MTATAGNLILPAARRTARLTASDALTDRCRLMCGAGAGFWLLHWHAQLHSSIAATDVSDG